MSTQERERAQVIKAMKAISDARFEIEMLAAEFGEKDNFVCDSLSKKLTEMMGTLAEERL